MGRSASAALWLSSAALVASVVACNLFSGVSDLDPSGVAAPADGAAGGGGGGDAGGGDEDAQAPAPGTPCGGAPSMCYGKVASACVDGLYQQTTCDQACAAGVCVPYPSCQGSTVMCGSPAASCCATATVPAGTFQRPGLPGNQAAATVSAFDLDVFDVTVARFRAFVATGGGTQASPPANGSGAFGGIGWQASWNQFLPATTTDLLKDLGGGTYADKAPTNDDLPVTTVPWLEAWAFCAWDGGRLPTITELEYAAMGGADQRYYPWSTGSSDQKIDGSHAAYDCAFKAPAENCPSSYCSDDSSSPCDTTTCVSPASCVTPACTGCEMPGDVAPVGSFPAGAGKWGQLDLAGDVDAWTLDVDLPSPSPCTDCTTLTTNAIQQQGLTGHMRPVSFMMLGGAWDDGSSQLQTRTRFSRRADQLANEDGIRCVH